MKWTKGKIATHAAVFALALLAAMTFGTATSDDAVGNEDVGKSAAGAGTTRPVRPQRPGGSPPRKAGTREGGEEKFSAADFKKAWEAIAFRDLTIQQRTELQQELLSKWSLIDLEGALKAALSVHWDGWAGGVDGLLHSFEEAFRQQPLEAWDLISSGKFGLGGQLVKDHWVAATVDGHPMLVMSVFNELPSSRKGETLKAITDAVARDPALREDFLAKLCEQPQTAQLSVWMSETIRKLGPSGTAEEVGAKLSAAASDQERTRYIHEFGLALKGADLSSIIAEWDKLSPELRQRASRSVMLHADAKSDIPGLVTQMIQLNEWQNLHEQGGKISDHGYQTGREAELAGWTSALPDQKESRYIFSRAVEPYIVNNPMGARSWIENLPDTDWRRDQALAEYSRHVLWRMNSKDESSWAIESITDPKVREHVLGVRAAWARERGTEP